MNDLVLLEQFCHMFTYLLFFHRHVLLHTLILLKRDSLYFIGKTKNKAEETQGSERLRNFTSIT